MRTIPGGKLEPGEERLAGLRRELGEEIGVELVSARPLITVNHRYPDLLVQLDVWRVEAWRGLAYGKEGQAVEWVHIVRTLKSPTYVNTGFLATFILENTPK